MVKLVSENNSSELLERVTGTNQTKPDTDATLADAKEDKNQQKEMEAEDECENYEHLMKMMKTCTTSGQLFCPENAAPQKSI